MCSAFIWIYKTSAWIKGGCTRSWLLPVIFVFRTALGVAQDSMHVEYVDGFPQHEVSTVRKVASTTMVGGMLAFSLIWSYDSWWKSSKSAFFFKDENWWTGEHLGVDKAGHMFTSYFYFNTIRDIMLWGGYKPSTAFWWGAGSAAFFALAVEIGDGLGGVGFDYQDLVFNSLGLTFGMLRTSYPFLKNFSLKWSYVPPDGFEYPPRFTKHYDGHTYWLALNLHNLLPEPLQKFWPALLQPAIGYGVDDHVTKREFVIGLDFNLEVFTPPSEDWLLVQRVINKFHIPAPAVKFMEDKKPRYYLFHLN